jgi:hypothetical protein
MHLVADCALRRISSWPFRLGRSHRWDDPLLSTLLTLCAQWAFEEPASVEDTSDLVGWQALFLLPLFTICVFDQDSPDGLLARSGLDMSLKLEKNSIEKIKVGR